MFRYVTTGLETRSGDKKSHEMLSGSSQLELAG